MHIPSWVEKYRLKYLEMEHKRSQMDFEQQREFVIDKTNYLHIISVLKLEELHEAGLNSYYKGTLTAHANTLEFVIIIPFAYP